MTQKQPPLAPELMKSPPKTMHNPYIMNFCKVLVEKKGEEHGPEVRKKLLNDMYRLFENMLGQNMIDNLPEDLRRQYLSLTEDLSSLTYEAIGEFFDKNVPNYQEIMKATMKEFSEIFMRNRKFDPMDYPVAIEPMNE